MDTPRKGGRENRGRSKPSILENVLEAVVGAMHRDKGGEEGLQSIQHWLEAVSTGVVEDVSRDPRNRLGEEVASLGSGWPVYQLDESGPEPGRRFVATVWVDGSQLGEGSGNTKKDARKAAAENALETLAARKRP